MTQDNKPQSDPVLAEIPRVSRKRIAVKVTPGQPLVV